MEEAAKLLQGVKEEYPRARLFLANSLVARGEVEQAIEEIKGYVNSPRATENGVAQEWIVRLERELKEKRAEAELVPAE